MRSAPGPSNRAYGAILALSSKKKFNRKKKKVAYRLKEEYRVSNCANQSRLVGISPNIGSDPWTRPAADVALAESATGRKSSGVCHQDRQFPLTPHLRLQSPGRAGQGSNRR